MVQDVYSKKYNNSREKRSGKTVSLKCRNPTRNNHTRFIYRFFKKTEGYITLYNAYKKLKAWSGNQDDRKRIDKTHITKHIIDCMPCQTFKPADKWDIGSTVKKESLGYIYWFRTLNGWLWTFNIRDSRGVISAVRYRFVELLCKDDYLNCSKRIQHPICTYDAHYTEYQDWLIIRQIQTFIFIVTKLNYRIMHVPKDIIKLIMNELKKTPRRATNFSGLSPI